MVKTKNGKLYVGFWPKEQRQNDDVVEAVIAVITLTAMLLWGVINLF